MTARLVFGGVNIPGTPAPGMLLLNMVAVGGGGTRAGVRNGVPGGGGVSSGGLIYSTCNWKSGYARSKFSRDEYGVCSITSYPSAVNLMRADSKSDASTIQ